MFWISVRLFPSLHSSLIQFQPPQKNQPGEIPFSNRGHYWESSEMTNSHLQEQKGGFDTSS